MKKPVRRSFPLSAPRCRLWKTLQAITQTMAITMTAILMAITVRISATAAITMTAQITGTTATIRATMGKTMTAQKPLLTAQPLLIAA